MSRGATWANSDGLTVGFGTHSVDNDVPAVTANPDGSKTMKMTITLADLPDTFAATNKSPQNAVIRRGSIIKSAHIQTLVAATSAGAATLDVGTWALADTEVVDDADGIVADVTIAEMTTIGEVHVCDGALVNASGVTAVGAVGDADCVIAPSYETAVFTAGSVELVVTYFEPGYTDPLLAVN
jgi:hypothetical protein